MSDNNAFMISDIDDSESDELSGEYKNDTINIPDQALNSDVYLDYNSPNAKKCESIIHNVIQNIIPKDDDKINTNESSNEDDNDYFAFEKEDSDLEKDQHSLNNSDQAYNAKDKDDVEVDNEEETKNEISDEDSNEEETKNEISDEDNNEEETKNEINNKDDNGKETKNIENVYNDVEENIENDEENSSNDNFSDKIDENNDEGKSSENKIDSNVDYEIKSHIESKYDNNEEKEDENINEENFVKKNNDVDESNDFADESNDLGDDSSHHVHDIKKDDDDDNDISSKSPIIEPPIDEKTEKPHRHRNLHRKKKNKAKEEKEDVITENENKDLTNEKATTRKKQSTKVKDKLKTEKKVEENSANRTIDEIADISINNGDYSLINQSNIEKVMSKIRKMQRDALDEGDYELAKKAQLATQSAIRYYNEKQLIKHNTNRACEINVQLQATRDDIGFLKEHWARVLENAKQKANEDLLQLRDEQDRILKEFDDDFKVILSDPENLLPLEYKKSSSAVLILKKKQSTFISTNNFKMAKLIKKEIQELEEKERNENLLKFQKKKTAERNLLIKKQDEMFAVRKDNWYRTIEGIKSVANYEIDHARRCEKQLESKFIQTNEFSNKLLRQQQQRTSSLQTKKNVQMQETQQFQSSDRENVKTVTHTQFTIQRNAQKVMAQEFRQRAMINRIIYTNRISPRVKKPVPTPRSKKQYMRTPR